MEKLGGPRSVGERLINEVFSTDEVGREADLIEAHEREAGNHTFYDIEYTIHLPNRDRHELATVVIDNGSLYTLAASTNENRWPRVKSLFERIIPSMTFFSS